MRPWLTLAALAVAATLAPGAAALAADRAALGDGALWRLWTGPLRHADPAHLTRDLLGLLGLAVMMRGRLAARTTGWLIALALPLPVVGALLGDATLTGYYGLSGLVHALCVVALADLAATRPRWALPLALAMGAKLWFELTTGGLWVPLDGTRPAVWGHAAGVALGVVFAVGSHRLRARSPSGAASERGERDTAAQVSDSCFQPTHLA